MLIYDRATLARPIGASATWPVDTGDVRAMTNIQAAEYLAAKYPDKVEVARMPDGTLPASR